MADQNIIYIDPFSDTRLSFAKDHIEVAKEYKKSFIGSRVSFDSIITYSFKASKTISDENLKATAEIKMYEEAGLDLEKKYKIDYIKKELDYEESFLIECVAVNLTDIEPVLDPILKKTGYIDFLSIPFLVFSTLYQNKILSAKNDIFVYISDNEAFLSIYKNTKYISSISLTTLSEIQNIIKNDYKDISLAQIKETLKTKGFDESKYQDDEAGLINVLKNVFSDMMSRINNTAMHNRSIFGFDKMDRIFFSINEDRVKGLREFIISLGYENIEIRDFNLLKNTPGKHFYNTIAASYVYDKYTLNDNSNNLSTFERLPPFYQRDVGKLSLFVIVVFLISFAYPAYLYLQTNILQKQKIELQNRYDKLKRVTDNIKSQLINTKKQIRANKILISKQNTKISNINKGVDELSSLKTKEKRSSTMILQVNKYLQKYKLSLKSIKEAGSNKMTIEIIASYAKRDTIAKFMKDLIKIGFVEVSTSEIKLDKNYYISKIEIIK